MQPRALSFNPTEFETLHLSGGLEELDRHHEGDELRGFRLVGEVLLVIGIAASVVHLPVVQKLPLVMLAHGPGRVGRGRQEVVDPDAAEQHPGEALHLRPPGAAAVDAAAAAGRRRRVQLAEGLEIGVGGAAPAAAALAQVARDGEVVRHGGRCWRGGSRPGPRPIHVRIDAIFKLSAKGAGTGVVGTCGEKNR